MISSFIDGDDVVTDIGADHGYMAMFLAGKFSKKVYATEYGKGPFYKLIDNVERLEYQNLVECYQADGLDGLRNDCNALIIAGMGGKTISEMLARRPTSLSNIRKLVLEPQSEAFLVRDFINQNGFVIAQDFYVMEKGKAYPIIVAMRGYEEEPYLPYELMYGRLPIKEHDEILLTYLGKTIGILSRIEDEGRLNEKSKVELSLARTAIDCMKK